MIYTHVFWDFNGTVFDDAEAGFQTINILLSRYHLPTFQNIDCYRNAFSFPIIEFYQKMGFDFEKWDYNQIAKEWLELYTYHTQSSGYFACVPSCVQSLKVLGAKQIIFSAGEIKTLKIQLNVLGISNLFDDILGNSNPRGDGKTALGLQYMQKHSPQRAVLIGDTNHDFEVAKAMGIDVVLVSKGHQSEKILQETGAPVFCDLPSAVHCLKECTENH